MRPRAVLVVLAAAFTVLIPAAQAHAAPLEAGVGRADITPPTGYPFGGWVRAEGSRFSVPAPDGARVAIPAGGARDRLGNRSGERERLR